MNKLLFYAIWLPAMTLSIFAQSEDRADGSDIDKAQDTVEQISEIESIILLDRLKHDRVEATDHDNADDLTKAEEAEEAEAIIEVLINEEDESLDKIQHILKPANTSSPRDTLISFIKITQRFYELISSEKYNKDSRAERYHLFKQMEEFFDLRETPPSHRESVANESAVFLREILDRTGIPPLDEIPDLETMLDAIEEGAPPSWTIPNTPIEIVLIDSGDEEGKFQISADNVEELKELYHSVKHFPQKETSADGYYEEYFLTPNPIIPQAWIDALPDWSKEEYNEQTFWQWISMILVVILTALLIWLNASLIKRISRNWSPLGRSALWLLVPSFAIALIFFSIDLIDDKIFITGSVLHVINFIAYLAILLAAIVLAYALGTVAADIIVGTPRFRHRDFDATLARLTIRILSLIAAIAVMIEGLHHIGFSITTVIAGAGVTGLAIALAAQSALRNIFGSLMLLLDKPFRVGERIKVHGFDGVVEEIGMRSTKLRQLDGHLTTIPNEHMADADIENVAKRPYIRRLSNITITYDTPLPKVRRAVEIIKEVLAVPDGKDSEGSGDRPGLLIESQQEFEEKMIHPNEVINNPDFPPRVVFNDFNPDSLNILMIYWYFPPDYWKFMPFSQCINEEIMRRFEEEGIEFAFPTQTIHLASGEKPKPFPQIESEDEAR